MNRRFLLIAGIAGATGVGAGAFGAHALREHLDAAALVTWDTAVRYQLWHALALALVAVLVDRRPDRVLSMAGFLFSGGILLFCGSLYALAAGGPRWLGPVTPLGGAAFVAGWASLAAAGIRGSRRGPARSDPTE